MCRQSSAPIEPPAPVTITTRLPSHSPSPALSRTTGSRPSRSSSSIVRIVVSAERPLIRSSYDGTVSTSIPASAQISATRRRTPCAADGSATITWRTPYFLRPRREARDRAQHAHAVQQASALRGIVVDEPDHAPLPASRELAREARPGLAGADHEHRLAERGERAVEAMLLPDPVREAVAGHQEDEHRSGRRSARCAARPPASAASRGPPGSAARPGPRRTRSAAGRGGSRIATGRGRGRRRRRSRPAAAGSTRACDPCRRGRARWKSRPNRTSTSQPRRALRPQRSWTKASHALKLWGCFIVVLLSACANDNQCRQKARRSLTTHAASTCQPAFGDTPA